MTKKILMRILLCLIAASATIATFTDHLVYTNGDGRPITLFFTAWSVWFITIVAFTNLFITLRHKSERSIFLLIWFCAIVMIFTAFMVTLVTYVIDDRSIDYWSLGSIFKHILLPVATLIDGYFFFPVNSVKKYYPLAGPVPGIIYWAVILVRAVNHHQTIGEAIPRDEWTYYYPYDFVNYDVNGNFSTIILLLLSVAVITVLLGYLVRFINKKKPSR